MSKIDELEFALQAITAAADLVRTIGREMISEAISKSDQSPVTVGDFAAQAVVGKMLAGELPDDALVGEESAAELRTESGAALLGEITRFVSQVEPAARSETVCDWIDRGSAEARGRYWTLDPIDGTKGFLRGDQYAVCLALVEDGEVQIGALACPELTSGEPGDEDERGMLYFAQKDGGASCAPMQNPVQRRTIHVSTRADSSQARIFRSFEASHTHGDKVDELATLLGVTVDPVRMDSQAKYAMLSSGHGEVLLRLLSPKRPDYREMIWDQAAGSLIVAEAGGRVTDLDGKPLDFSQGKTLAQNRGVVATNGALHDVVLEGLQKIGA
ncbi:MAG: 3'(2'),5'-bisphosphate nucleotidase [Pirellulales bacterium]|nr:3'(2'),5'-bisphosphate nucleotidase [Pirellulales bacterium]